MAPSGGLADGGGATTPAIPEQQQSAGAQAEAPRRLRSRTHWRVEGQAGVISVAAQRGRREDVRGAVARVQLVADRVQDVALDGDVVDRQHGVGGVGIEYAERE